MNSAMNFIFLSGGTNSNGKQYVWVWRCGEARLLDNGVLEWDLDGSCGDGPGNQQLQHQRDDSEGSIQCQCRGEGLFGLVLVQEPKVRKGTPLIYSHDPPYSVQPIRVCIYMCCNDRSVFRL